MGSFLCALASSASFHTTAPSSYTGTLFALSERIELLYSLDKGGYKCWLQCEH